MPRITTPLSDTKIRKAKPQDKMYKMFDGNGLYLEVKPNGRKVWRIKYRFNGKEKTYTIGDYPQISLSEARNISRDVKQKVLEGIDPVEARAEKKKRNNVVTIEQIANEFLNKKKEEISPKTFADLKRKVDLYIVPELGNEDIKKIKKRDIVNLIKKSRYKKTQNNTKTDKPDTARRVFTVLKQIYKYALHNDYTEIDPTAAIDINEILPKREVKNFEAIIDENEIKKMYKDFFENYKGYDITLNALKFLFLTALRPINVRNLRWEWIDLEKKVAIYPAEAMKTRKEYRLPLTDTLIEILENMAFFKGKRSGIVFFNVRDKNRMMAEGTLVRTIKRYGYNHQAHGFRTSFSTICYEKQKDHGFSAEVIEAQLAHAIGNTVTRAYMRSDFLKERRKLLEWWEDFLES